jgi:RNA polymerase sigma-70 factor (ECF subfamily)
MAVQLMGDQDLAPLGEFHKLYTEHHAWVWRLLSRFGVPEAGLDDALQDVFIVVHRRQGDHDGTTPIRAWIAGITRRVASKHARTQRRARRKTEAMPLPDAAPGPDDQLNVKEAVGLLDDFLAGLSSEHRETFVLSDVEGWTAPEIAAALDVKLGTVYSRLHTARAHFTEAAERWRNASRRPHAP